MIEVLPERFAEDGGRPGHLERAPEMLASRAHPDLSYLDDLDQAGDACFRAIVLQVPTDDETAHLASHP